VEKFFLKKLNGHRRRPEANDFVHNYFVISGFYPLVVFSSVGDNLFFKPVWLRLVRVVNGKRDYQLAGISSPSASGREWRTQCSSQEFGHLKRYP
jgi:hypothetical protein